MSLRLAWIVDFVNLRRGTCHPGNQAGEFKVTVPEASATSHMPGRASRMEFANRASRCCGSIDKQIVGIGCGEHGGYIAFGILPVFEQNNQSTPNPEGVETLKISEELSSYRRRVSVGPGAWRSFMARASVMGCFGIHRA